MKHFNLFKELYFNEFDRKQHVKQSIKIQIGLITIILSALYFLTTAFNYDKLTISSYIFTTVSLLVFVCLIISILFLIKAYSNFFKGYNYSYMAYAQNLNDWYLNLNHHYEKYYNNSTQGEIEFDKYLINNFAKHVDHNIHINDIRSSSLYKSNIFIILSLIFLFIIAIFYALNIFFKKIIWPIKNQKHLHLHQVIGS